MSRHAVPWLVRFWGKVHKTERCWIWTGATNDGYGIFDKQLQERYAHRIVWALTVGPIPFGLRVLHTCDVRACVRPDHLLLGTQADNMIDMVEKGRYGPRRGVAKQTKVTAQQVIEIRRNPDRPLASVAYEFGISRANVWAIRNRLTWNDLDRS
jgi:hypothetical protein